MPAEADAVTSMQHISLPVAGVLLQRYGLAPFKGDGLIRLYRKNYVR
jgi:hypothetical protein